MERRLQSRYLTLVRSQISVSPRTAAGPALLPATEQAASLAQAACRFYNNPRVGLPELLVPLRRAGIEACRSSPASVVLLVHDLSKIDYCPHASKADRRQLTHRHNIGYDLTTSLLVGAHDGAPIAPVELHLKTADAVHSTSPVPPPVDQAHVHQIEAVMERSDTWGLSRPVVHVIDREADSLGHFRRWQAAGHLFLVRCDDRRVLWNSEPALISETCVKLLENGAFSEQSRVTHRGVAARRQVAQMEVVLHRPHKTRVGGVQKDRSGPPLRLRLVVSRILDEAGGELVRWTLLTNAPESAGDAARVALWYPWRWRIESFQKLLKSHGQEIERWRRETGGGVARRLLVVAMSLVHVWALERDSSPAAERTKDLLVRLSGRRMSHKVRWTTPSLLAGSFVLLTMTAVLEEEGLSLTELKQHAQRLLAFENST